MMTRTAGIRCRGPTRRLPPAGCWQSRVLHWLGAIVLLVLMAAAMDVVARMSGGKY